MNETLENIFEQPTSVKVGILGGALALVLVGYWLMFYGALVEQKTQLTADIDQRRLEVAEKQGIVANLDRFTAEVDKLDIELAKALKELPDKGEIHLLLAKISDKAQDSGLDIKLFQPSPEVKRDFYAEVPVAIEVDGTFHQVATFFDEVGHLDRLVNLLDFSLIDPSAEDSQSVIKTTVVAKAFRFLDESERPKPQEETKGKRRGRR